MADEGKKSTTDDGIRKSALEAPPPGKWQILYWPAFGPTGKIFAGAGRAEYLRVMFEEADVPYEDISEGIKEYFWSDTEAQPRPVLAPPVIRKDDFVLCQTPVCAKHLAVEFGMYPSSSRDDASRAEQIVATVHEYIAEGRMAFHPVKNSMSYHDQVEEAKPYIEAFKKERLPRYMSHFERCLEANNTIGGSSFFVGNSLTYVDLQVMVMLQVTRFQVPDAWEKLDAPLLKAFLDGIEARPRIRAYLDSDRKRPFAGDSFM